MPSDLRCSRCLGVNYCSVNCQRNDWLTHKVQCSEAQRIKKQMGRFGYKTVEEVEERLKEEKRSADLGCLVAQYNVSLSLSSGLGVTADKEEALKYLKKAAEGGLALALCSLGDAYSGKTSYGLPKDMAKGFKCYKSAAESGHLEAQHIVAHAFETGRGVSKDQVEAVFWFKKAAEVGHGCSQYHLSLAYSSGDGIDEDIEESFKWLVRAAEGGIEKAQHDLGHAYERGDSGTNIIDPLMAISWFEKASEHGNSCSQYHLGRIYFSGRVGVPMDKVEGLKWIKLAAKNGESRAIKYLELIEKENSAREKALLASKAVELLEKANSELAMSAREKKTRALKAFSKEFQFK